MHKLTLDLIVAMNGFCDAKHMRRVCQTPWIINYKSKPFIVATNGHAIAAVKLRSDDIRILPDTAIQLPHGKLMGAKHGYITVQQTENVVEFLGQYEYKAVALPACEYELIFMCLKIFSHKSNNESAQATNDAAVDVAPKYTNAREKLLSTLHTDTGSTKRTPTSVFNCYINTKVSDKNVTRLQSQHTASVGVHVIIMALNYGYDVVTSAPSSMFE